MISLRIAFFTALASTPPESLGSGRALHPQMLPSSRLIEGDIARAKQHVVQHIAYYDQYVLRRAIRHFVSEHRLCLDDWIALVAVQRLEAHSQAVPVQSRSERVMASRYLMENIVHRPRR
jgi:hypothetical protein